MSRLNPEMHEAAEIFPLDEENLAELAEDIRKNGQLVPIEKLKGKILDGRRRYRACKLAGVVPLFQNVEASDPIQRVLSLNLHRRHLETSQRGMVGARARDLYEAEARQRQSAGKGKDGSGGRGKKRNLMETLPQGLPKGTTRDMAGEAVGVSGKTIDKATKVLKRAVPEVIKAVDDGRMTVSAAERLIDEPADVQRKEAARPKGERPEKKPTHEEVVEACTQHAINWLAKIPKDSPLRNYSFDAVQDWIAKNY